MKPAPDQNQPKPCQFTVAAGGGVCGSPPLWCNECGSSTTFFCAEHKTALEQDEWFGGRWFELCVPALKYKPNHDTR